MVVMLGIALIALGMGSQFSLRAYLCSYGADPSTGCMRISVFDLVAGYRLARLHGDKPFFVYGFIILPFGLALFALVVAALKHVPMLA